MDSLVPIKRAELAVGNPLPWPVYDASNNLLMNEGVVIQNQRQLDALYEKGVYRNPTWDTKPRRQAKPTPLAKRPAEEKSAPPLPRKDCLHLKFSDMKLGLGDRLQLQEMTGEKTRHLAKVVGYLDGQSLIVTHPAKDGKPLVFLERQPLIVRVFSGKHAFAFETHLLKSYPTPYPHLHLGCPKHVEQKEIRGSERIACDIIASVAAEGDPDKRARAGVMTNLSISGARITSKEALGTKGAAVVVAFRCQSSHADEYLTLRGILRQVDFDADDGRVQHGVEFIDLSNNDRLILENTIYRLRFEGI